MTAGVPYCKCGIAFVTSAILAGASVWAYRWITRRICDKKGLDTLPIIDLAKLMLKQADGSFTEDGLNECKKVMHCLSTYGVIVVRDPRVTKEDNDKFLDMMESYFEQADEVKRKDSHPEYHYQVGVTPEKTEQPKNHCSELETLSPLNRPVTLCPPEKDAKWRFFWRIGKRPKSTEYEDLNAEPVVPEAFKDGWSEVMDKWGNQLLQSVLDISEAVSFGLSLPEDYLRKKMECGPHLLAPTGTDLHKYGDKNTVMAGYHTDLNFITCHGKSRYPGLYIWLRDGTKMEVRIPDGCLLMQCGQQLEYLTGGFCMAGYHEVIVSENTRRVIEEKKKANKSLWRVSSTLFSHLRSDDWLEPLPQYSNEEYPRIKVGDQVQQELQNIKLSNNETKGIGNTWFVW
jgi:isopenicillin N synthase-like dioxygenase